jgi:hypothetical protein
VGAALPSIYKVEARGVLNLEEMMVSKMAKMGFFHSREALARVLVEAELSLVENFDLMRT